jgi:hypothetical protein
MERSQAAALLCSIRATTVWLADAADLEMSVVIGGLLLETRGISRSPPYDQGFAV